MITYEGMEYRVIAYLGDIRRRYKDWDACKQRIREARESLLLSGVSYSDMPGSPNTYGDAIPDGLALLDQRCSEMAEAIAEHEIEIDRAWKLCRPLASDNRYCLWLHYIEEMSWRAVGRELHASARSVYRMRVDGIVELYEAMPEEWRRDDLHKAEI